MIKIIKNKLKKNLEISTLAFLIILTVISTSYYNYKKELNNEIYLNFIDNIYFKKTLNHIVNNLEPKYKKFKHKIKSGETELCANNGVEYQEFIVGNDGLAFSNSNESPQFKLSITHIYAALVNELPGGGINKDTDELKTNMLQSWNEVDAFVSSITGNPKVGLPNQPISIMVTPPTSGTRDAMGSLFDGIGSYYLMGIPFLFFVVPFIDMMEPLMIVALGVTLILTGLACAYIAMSLVTKNSEMAIALVTAVLIAFGGEYMWLGIVIGLILSYVLVDDNGINNG
jgi:hypothetical protein